MVVVACRRVLLVFNGTSDYDYSSSSSSKVNGVDVGLMM